MVTLPTIEVPGLRDAIRKERTIRDRAFLGGNEVVAGVEVRQLSVRTVLYLEHAENGFMIPFRFDDDNEVLAHATQVLYFSTPDWRPPALKNAGMLRAFVSAFKINRFQRSILSEHSPDEIIDSVRQWTNESFIDCPRGSSAGGMPKPSYASYPAHLVDLFAAAGLMFTYGEIMDMPLKRLWQHWRLASARVYDSTLTNPSDELSVTHIARGVA